MKKTTTKTAKFAKKLLVLLLMFSSLHLMAQKAPHEFSINAAAGISTYAFSPTPKKASSLGYNCDFGFGFTGFFSRQVGVHVGAGFGLFNVKSKVNKLYSLTPDLYDKDIELHYELHTTLNGYNDIHKTLYINLPVMIHFQTIQKQYWSWKNTQKAGFYAMGGFKVLFLFNNKYEARVPTMYNAAYYPTLNNWADTQEFKGFGTFKGNAVTGSLDFGVLVTFSLEMGVKWRIENNMFIYTGVFFDCGLNDPIKDSRKPYNQFTEPYQLKEMTILKYADRANLMAVGVKVHFAFSRKARAF
jgi:hypothetical protein